MPDPTDVIVPMLQRIQSDVADLKLDVSVVKTDLSALKERFGALGPYVTYTMGLHTQDKLDIERHDEEIATIKQRLDQLEAQRS